LGQLFEEKGILDKAEDIFYLYRVEIDRIMEEISAGSPSSCREIISARRDEMQSTSDYILPSVIYGDSAPILETGRVRNHRGVGTSAGIYTGKTRVVRASGDFQEVVKGEVVLIPFSDVSWTPILTMAGAIVSETGGLLSHSSIIAREMGIPALVSVENACSIGNGLIVTVDGSNGILSILDYD
jgi:pyruvate,water dikinase